MPHSGYSGIFSSRDDNPSSPAPSTLPLPLREQRVTRREELCAQHEEELARLAREIEYRHQHEEADRAAWEKFKTDLEAVQVVLDARQRELEGVEYAFQTREREVAQRQQQLLDREAALAAKERELTERSERLATVAQRLKQREESIDAREAQLAREPQASHETAVKRETELSAPAPTRAPEPLPAGSSLSVGPGVSRPAEAREEQQPRFPGPPTSAFQPNDDSEPSITEQYTGLAGPELSVLMADQVMLRAAARGSSVPGEGGDGAECVFAHPEESMSGVSRAIMD